MTGAHMVHAKLLVPKGKVAVYQSTAGWNCFAEISELDDGDGDANGDGEVDIADAEAIMDYLLGNPPAGFNAAAADVNGDGVVDIADAVAMLDIIMNSGGAGAP